MHLARSVVLDGQVIPAGTAATERLRERISNPAAWSDGVDPLEALRRETGEAPPRAGPGSGVEAWRAYANSLGIDVPEDRGRDDIIADVAFWSRP